MLADLQQAGYVRRRKVGRHNSYEINANLPLRDPTLENELVGDRIALARKKADASVMEMPSRPSSPSTDKSVMKGLSGFSDGAFGIESNGAS
jgi:hypothetical protein